MKVFLFVFKLCLLCCLGVNTAKSQVLLLHHADGNTTEIDLVTLPQVKFQDERILISSEVYNMEFSKDDVIKFTFQNNTSGIQKPLVDISHENYNGSLVFHGIKESDIVELYNTKGERIPIRINRNGDVTTILLSTIPSGVYLLNVNGKTTKFSKK